ncbi:MAG TPA: amino acid permease [Sphingomicrobium sp.]|nr:amino acid permease [Sphingomicrobium sp.]
MGFWLTTGLVVGSMVGSGIFMLPVSLAPLGANAVVGWLVSICGALAVAFALARLSRAGGGGIQSYIEQPFGPLAGFIVTWAFWCSNWTSQAAVAIAFGSAVSRISPALAGADGVVGAAVAAILVLTCVNALGVRASGGLNLVTVAIKLIPLVGVVLLLALAGVGGEPLQPLAPVPLGIANIATATTLTLFALTGFENATTPVGKVRDPARTLPRAILGGTALVGLIYLLSSSGVLLLLPSEQVAASPAPYADVFAARWGEGAVLVAAGAIAVSAFGTLNCLILATGELGYAMAARRQLPALMARTRGANTPFVAQGVGASLAILLVLANSSKATASLFTFIILLSTSAVLLVYLAGALAAWRTSRSTGVRAVIVLALAFVAFALYGSGLEADLWLLALLAVGFAVYAVMTRLNRSIPAAAGSPAAPPGSAA